MKGISVVACMRLLLSACALVMPHVGVGDGAMPQPVFVTKLPIVKITVDSEPTRQKERHTGTLEVVGNGTYGDVAAVKVEDIHVRGNWTAAGDWSKFAYKIKLAKKTDMFGMGKQKHWVLLANYFDPTLLNNRIASDLARAVGVLSMDSEWVELFINGEYRGVYQFCEQIRIDKNRVPLHDWSSPALPIHRFYRAILRFCAE